MEVLIDNWYIIVALLAGVVIIVAGVYHFFKLPTEQQIENLKEWLKWACIKAEAQLGSKTGQAKLRYVYDLAINKFKWLSFVSFEQFSSWVDEALIDVKRWLEDNKNLSDYVK